MFQYAIAKIIIMEFTKKYELNAIVVALNLILLEVKCLTRIAFNVKPRGVMMPNRTGIHLGRTLMPN